MQLGVLFKLRFVPRRGWTRLGEVAELRSGRMSRVLSVDIVSATVKRVFWWRLLVADCWFGDLTVSREWRCPVCDCEEC
jgi:hypothetical protein